VSPPPSSSRCVGSSKSPYCCPRVRRPLARRRFYRNHPSSPDRHDDGPRRPHIPARSVARRRSRTLPPTFKAFFGPVKKKREVGKSERIPSTHTSRRLHELAVDAHSYRQDFCPAPPPSSPAESCSARAEQRHPLTTTPKSSSCACTTRPRKWRQPARHHHRQLSSAQRSAPADTVTPAVVEL
jgi:hypothetical protein